ncbi:hypothetical protein [Achromobacter xylosoxidans]|uniref:Uncharacterized protein n=1 Tax=Alcaligenes xylosoxydans xylosoxydans TaxID=85698 RepID=A0A1R1JUI2_ALCXX|nr:hypothetical protein [Achromobacter xylosoxidans]OMG88022.1 hypothetical protein BIZ92_10530 [Achromobacter xylosoxidans]
MKVDETLRRAYPIWLMKYALKKALARPSPDTIPLAPKSRLVGRNCATTYILGVSVERYWLIDKIDGEQVQLRDLESPGNPVPGSAKLRDMRRANVRVVVYFEQLEWEFNSLYRYAWFAFVGQLRFRATLDNVLQRLANRASLPTLERIHALEVACERASRGEKNLTLRHILPIKGRQHGHPDLPNAFKFHQFVLDSLVHTGEIRELPNDLGNYEILPKALVTLEQYRREERRIKAQSNAAFWTAVAAVIIGAIAAAVIK